MSDLLMLIEAAVGNDPLPFHQGTKENASFRFTALFLCALHKILKTMNLTLTLFIARLVAAQGNCPSACLPPACICASKDSPLPVDVTPQFVSLTWDDAVQENQDSVIAPILSSLRNPNGCSIPSTYFVSIKWTKFNVILMRMEMKLQRIL
jgi:hypothetical protein